MTRLPSALFFCILARSLSGADVSLTTDALALAPGAGLIELGFTSPDSADGTFGLFAVLGPNNSVWADNDPDNIVELPFANPSLGGRARIGEITATNGITDGPLVIGVVFATPPMATENLTGWQLLLQIDGEADASGTVAIESASLPSNYILDGLNFGLTTRQDPAGFFAFDFANGPLGALLLDGDFNGDSIVNSEDLDLVLLHWGADGLELSPEWVYQRPPLGTVVGGDQLDPVLLHWNQSLPSTEVSSVPEPTTLGSLAVMSIIVVLGCRGAARRSRFPDV